MAQPISLKMAPRDPKHELLMKLEHAPADHAEALLDGYELLQQLHEYGIFSLTRGLLGAGGKIIETIAEDANSEAGVRATRNAIILAKALGSIDPEILLAMSTAMSESLATAKNLPQEPPGLFTLLKRAMGADARRGLGLFTGILSSVGARLTPGGKHDS